MVKLTAEQYLNKCIIKRRHDDARREKVWSVLIAGMLWVSTACIIKFLILAL